MKAYFRNRLLNFQYVLNEQDFLKGRFKDDFYLLLKICKCHRNIFISTTQSFGTWTNDISWLRPVKEIRLKIDFQKSNKNIIAIHIRRTDNIVSIENSPLELFEQVIDRYIASNVNVKFFLSTDDPLVKEKFGLIYPNNLVFLQHELNRNSCDGIRNALVDLFSLSLCGIIYGSYWSSFSTLAAVIGGSELKILKSDV